MKNSRGFTLIELMVVSAIMAVGATVATLYMANYRSSHNLNLALSEIIAVTRDTQNRSVTQQDGKQWGVRFNNSATDKYEVFSGSSYASGTIDRSYNFRQNIVFSEPTSDSVFDAIFESLTGHLNQNKIISLITGKSDNLIGDIIINTSGLITSRIEKNLVGYWHLDEGTSTIAYDTSSNNNNGTLFNSPTWQTASNCKAGKCLNFDGTDDYVKSGPSKTSIGANITISLFLKPGGAQLTKGILQFASDLSDINPWMLLQRTDSTNIKWYLNEDFRITQSVNDNIYYHIALIYDGTTWKAYKNGVLDGTYAGPIGIFNGDYFWMGNGYNGYFNGTIDEVRIYNRALSADEILQLYNDLK